MSLRHILNDEPPPVQSTPYSASPRAASAEHFNYASDSRHSPTTASPPRSYTSQHPPTDPQVLSRAQLPSPDHAEPAWDSRSREWTPEDHGSHASDGRQYPYEHDRTVDAQLHHSLSNEVSSRKRRKGHGDTEYLPSQSKRASPRKSTRKGKDSRTPSPASETMSNHAQDDKAPDSSDLEDYRGIWGAGLREYAKDTETRQKEAAKYFWETVVGRNSMTALDFTKHYATRIDSIPIPPLTPPVYSTGPHFEDDFDHTSGSRQNGQDDHYRRVPSEGAVLDQTKKKLDSKKPVPAKSDIAGDMDTQDREDDPAAPSAKRRKLDNDDTTGPHGLDHQEPSLSLKLSLSKLKGKAKQQREQSHDSTSVSATSKARKKPGPKKKTGLVEVENDIVSRPPSILGDVTPSASRPNSPIPVNSTMVYELDEQPPPMKRAKKVEDTALIKRIKTLEESQRKVWTNIARRDITKVYKYQTAGFQARLSQTERIAKLVSVQARKPFTKTAKANKDVQAKAKRLMREMQVFWKKNEKEERDVRKREQKEAMDRLKIEEEKREAARQARKLEFLISQTELYSHFVGNKLKTSEIEGEGEPTSAPAGAESTNLDSQTPLPEIDYDDEDQTNLHRHAAYNAQQALSLAKERAQQFDTQAALERKTNEALKLAKAQSHIHEVSDTDTPAKPPLMDLDSDELNFQNPTSLSGPLTVGQPKMLMAQLKEYQLKGLNWLATLYEQGINGILADEMGLGKTVQSISLLAYLAETHDIWGPFLVVAPASTLHNWQQELTRFVPKLKAIPYWGNVKDRTTLRKFWSKKEISYNEDAPFHVLITSYQLVTQDQQYFQRVKWQYMILDEAQNIKNSSSVRWKTLLGFHCRNRLLLTGTPIQNSMQELWALLHFIMPSLFDSHDEFNEWFSKDIENAAENKGSKLNEHQLRRLHMILKPFMLRRVKRHVQNELSEKIEIDIYVDLSPRQRALYSGLLANISVADLLQKAANIGDADSARSLMNLVMQFRKVCNHPELFERADVIAPFSFGKYGRSGPLNREGDFLILPYSIRNPIEYSVPLLFYRDGGFLDIPSERSQVSAPSLSKTLNIWSTDWIQQSLFEEKCSSFSFLRFIDLPAQDAHQAHISSILPGCLLALHREASLENGQPNSCSSIEAFQAAQHLRIISSRVLPRRSPSPSLPGLQSISTSEWQSSCLSRPSLKWYRPTVVAPPLTMYCNDRTFIDSQTVLRDAPFESLVLYGLPHHLRNSEVACSSYQQLVGSEVPPTGLICSSPDDQVPLSTMLVPEAKRLIYDSAKLSRLDSLLQELKTGDHRVLVYFQMTRMMDLMEEYLIYRQYKYLRLDGSSKLEDRRDMVIDWQTRPEIFVFLLSTRAGGLGINLTAADTVVFYDHDWNPSNDAQAMDRAHRLGQTRQVTVYRLITKGTIDERIIQLARVKKDVQDIVVGNKNFTDVTKPSEIVQLLLNDEQLASLEASKLSSNKNTTSTKQNQEAVRDLWNEEGDDFFGHSGSNTTGERQDNNGGSTPAQSTRGRRRKTGTVRRKPGPKKGAARGGDLDE